ncbi:MAG: DUF4143 domain-containing protein [Gammaproteobacteria bacterium]|nr:DUF4143 domain-containing protein [Gammaproteobacteria bacterium]MDE0514028.1 DUF4143 domain-containing protein [Gammaproteobacteria bacterium]
MPPYFQNYNKRIIRSPKFYFIDSGLVCALTRQPDAHAALAGQMGGALFEGMVVTEAGKDASDTGVLVCRTETIQQMPHGNLALPWRQFPAWLDGLLTRS